MSSEADNVKNINTSNNNGISYFKSEDKSGG